MLPDIRCIEVNESHSFATEEFLIHDGSDTTEMRSPT